MAAAHPKQLFRFLHFLPFLVFLNFNLSSAFIRKLSMVLNPGLNTSLWPPGGGDLLHIRAAGASDTLHFLLCSRGAPALLLVHTNNSQSTVKVDWSAFLSHNATDSLKVEPQSSVIYSSALVFVRLWEYDDTNDTADPQQVPDSAFLPPYELQNFTWAPLDNTTLDPERHRARLCGGDGSPGFGNGLLCLQLSAFEAGGRDQAWPRLLHSANASQIRVGLQGLRPRAERSRFLLELQAVAWPQAMERVEEQRYIDDEYTPSIFKVSQWLSAPNSTSSSPLGFIQWKPVAYRRPDPVLEEATPCGHAAPVALALAGSASALVPAFYGPRGPGTALNISFGIAGDAFYNSTRFLSWTLLVGVASPLVDSFSPLVLSIMAVGLGTPLLLLLVGGVWLCIRRLRPQPVYQPIN